MTNIIEVVDGRLVTNSLILAREFNRQHKSVKQGIIDLISRGNLQSDDFELWSQTIDRHRKRQVYTLTERGLMIFMLHSIGRKNHIRFDFIDEYFFKRERLESSLEGTKRDKFSLLKTWAKSFYSTIKLGAKH